MRVAGARGQPVRWRSGPLLALVGLLAVGCGGGGRLRLGTDRPPRPSTRAQPQPIRTLDLHATDQLAIGDRYLDLGYNFRAKREYMRVIENFPGSPEMAVAQYKIGTCYLREEMWAEALEQYLLFVANFPVHELEREARRRITLLEAKLPAPSAPAPNRGTHTAVAAREQAVARAAARSTTPPADAGASPAAAPVSASSTTAPASESPTARLLAEARSQAAREAEARQRADEGRLAAEEAAAERTREVAALREEVASLRRDRKSRQAADRRVAELERKWRAALEQAAAAEKKLAAAEARAARANAPEQQAAATTHRADLQAERDRAAAAEARVADLAARLQELEKRASAAEVRVRELSDQAARADQRANKAAQRARKAEQRRVDADRRAAEEAARRIAAAEARAAAATAARTAAEAEARAAAEAQQQAEARAAAESAARQQAEARARATVQGVNEQAEGEARTVAAQILHLDCRSLAEVERRLEEMASAGVNTVILRVFHNAGDRAYGFVSSRLKQGVYFRTDRAPVLQDVLGEVLPLAERAGLKVWAWMTTRYASYGLNLEAGWSAARYDFESGSIKSAKGLNLFHPQVQEHLAGLFRDLAAYPIDGVLFQDDLVLRHTEGMSEEARRAFAAEMGQPLDPRALYEGVYLSDDGKYYVSRYTERFWDWAAWKNRKVLQLAQRLMTAARGVRPELRFGINLMYEAVTSPRNALAWLAQSVAEARKIGFDLYSVMAYHRQMQAELGLNHKETAHLMAKLGREAVRMVGDPSRVLIKIQSRDWKTGARVPVAEQEEMLGRVLAAGGPVSLALVPVADRRDLEVLERVLSRPRKAAGR